MRTVETVDAQIVNWIEANGVHGFVRVITEAQNIAAMGQHGNLTVRQLWSMYVQANRVWPYPDRIRDNIPPEAIALMPPGTSREELAQFIRKHSIDPKELMDVLIQMKDEHPRGAE